MPLAAVLSIGARYRSGEDTNRERSLAYGCDSDDEEEAALCDKKFGSQSRLEWWKPPGLDIVVNLWRWEARKEKRDEETPSMVPRTAEIL